MSQKIQIKVPATSANIGSGIDCMGLALSKYLTVTLEECDRLDVRFAQPPTEPITLDSNLVYQGAKRIFDKAGKPFPALRMIIDSDIPFSRGMGSSAAALVAGAWGANAWLDEPFDTDTLLFETSQMEGHPDNIVPAALGGFTVAMMDDARVFYQRADLASDFKIIVAIPNYPLATSKARAVLPQQVPLQDVLHQVQRASYLVASMLKHDYRHLRLATDDLIFTPARRGLIPGYAQATEGAFAAGALAAMISGAGPTLLAFTTQNETQIAEAMRRGFQQAGKDAQAFALAADNAGVQISR